jgi:hypothetical protein
MGQGILGGSDPSLGVCKVFMEAVMFLLFLQRVLNFICSLHAVYSHFRVPFDFDVVMCNFCAILR